MPFSTRTKFEQILLAVIAAFFAVNVRHLHQRVSPPHQTFGDGLPLHRPTSNTHPPIRSNVTRQEDDVFLQFGFNYNSKHGNEASHLDAFSASWWQSTAKFLASDLFQSTVGPSPEGASFEVLKKHAADVRMTRDWLDLSVEHMSKWAKVMMDYDSKRKLMNETQTKLLLKTIEEKLVNIFKGYVHSNDRIDFFDRLPLEYELVGKSTIAVMAYMPSSSELSTWTLASTLLSLMQVGMGRIIVSGNQQSDEVPVRKAFSIVKNVTQTSWPRNQWTQLEFCTCANATTPSGFNIPGAALLRFRQVFENKVPDSISECWLGPGGSREKWKYVYLSEPDLVLTTKLGALPELGRALQSGQVLAPHRIQPLPHASDLTNMARMMNEYTENALAQFVIPNAPPFEEVVEIDSFSAYNDNSFSTSSSFDSCCDRGSYKPYLFYEKCQDFWWKCGYSEMGKNDPSIDSLQEDPENGMSQVVTAHKRLMGYLPFMRLKRGTGVVYATAEHGKTCRPQIGPCTRWVP